MNFLLLLLAGWIIFFVIREVSWTQFLKNKTQQQLSVFSVFCLSALWALQTGIQEGLDVHFLGLTLLTLSLGWRLSILIASLSTLAITVVGVASWSSLGVNLLLGAIWPVSLSYLVFLLTYSYLYKQLFIYIFVAGFFNAVLAMTAKMLVIAAYLALTGTYSWFIIKNDYLIILPLMALPEGLINGVSIAALVVYKPEWLCTFRDRDYLFKN